MGRMARLLTGPLKWPGFWHPAGVLTVLIGGPGVSLRSTPGYSLATLRVALPTAGHRLWAEGDR